MPSSIAERITQARIEARLTQRALAQACGVKPASVSAWESGDTKGLKDKSLYGAAKALGVTMEWLATGRGPMRNTGVAETGPDYPGIAGSGDGPPVGDYRATPIVGIAQLGLDGFWIETEHPVGHGEGYIDAPTRDPNAYSLEVRGDSMAPAIRDGWFVVVEPNSTVHQGEYVLIKTRDGRSMVKELLWERGGQVSLMSVNQEYERITLSMDNVEKMHHVAFVVPPSRRRL